MNRVRIFLLLLFVPLFASAQAGGTPSVFVDTDPMGARIFLDGTLLPERTPALLRGLTLGKHQVSLRRDGFVPALSAFEVAEGTVPTVEISLTPDSVVLAFPANDQVVDAEGPHPTEGRQFRYPSGTYQLADTQGRGLAMTPVFPDEGLLAVAGWGLAVLVGASLASAASDIYHINNGWTTHPSEVTAALWVSTLFELPWYGSLSGRKARFLRDAAPSVTALPERLDQAKALFALGEDSLQTGDLPRAAPLFTRVVKEFPESRLVPGAWFRLARIHSLTGRRDLALGEYRLVAETYPQAAVYDRAQKALADLYEAAGLPEKAIESLDRMVLADGFFDPIDIAAQKDRLVGKVPHAP